MLVSPLILDIISVALIKIAHYSMQYQIYGGVLTFFVLTSVACIPSYSVNYSEHIVVVFMVHHCGTSVATHSNNCASHGVSVYVKFGEFTI